jgi:hypothetical protein
MVGNVTLTYLASSLLNVAKVSTIVKSLPSGAVIPTVINGSGSVTPSSVSSRTELILNPAFTPQVPGTYVLTTVVTFDGQPSLSRTIDGIYTALAITPSPKPSASPKPTTPPVENDGEEEDFYGNLSVTKRSDGKYKIDLNSNIVEEQLVITATRKGFKSIVYRVETNEFGDVSIITSRKLSGFTLTLRFEGELLASVRAK